MWVDANERPPKEDGVYFVLRDGGRQTLKDGVFYHVFYEDVGIFSLEDNQWCDPVVAYQDIKMEWPDMTARH